MPKLTLAADFPERSQADWEALAAKGLQGAPLSSLASETLDGIPIEPIYAVAGLSGALAGLMASNEILGVQHRLSLGFVSGYGFVGIAVALMGRSHPVGVILASILFGVLYQGGAELAFEKPAITRDMIVVIQGLVILFAGALERQFRTPLTAIFGRRPTSAETQAAAS